MNKELFAYTAEYSRDVDLLEALRKCREQGFARMEVFSPYPVEGVDELLKIDNRILPRLSLLGGLGGVIGAFLLQYFANAVWYPQVIGGKPFFSLPTSVPIAFELGILGTGLTCFFVLLIKLKFLDYYDPHQKVDAFRRASHDRFFLSIRSDDPKFDPVQTRLDLLGLRAEAVHEVKE